MVLGLCRALLRDRAEAEDAAQQAFLSAHRALLNGAEPREPASWLATIARNECWARTSARMRAPLPSDAVDDAVAPNDPLAEAIRRADLAALWQAIEQLPRQQRDALLLREFGGLPYDELAAALAVSEPAVESLLFRARSRLRTQLKAAYAALSGASWVDGLARLLAGGGAPAAATKAVAVGLGAAAVTGGAVGTSLLAEHHPAPAHLPATAARTEAAAAPVAPRVAFFAPYRAPRTPAAVARRAAARPAARATREDAHAGEDQAPAGTSAPREHERVPTSSSPAPRDGGDSSGEAPSGDTASADASGSGYGDAGSVDGGDGTTTTTTVATLPTTTETSLTVPTTTTTTTTDGEGGD